MASNEGVENRPFPYLTVDADLLSNLRQSAAEGLFHSFDLLVGKWVVGEVGGGPRPDLPECGIVWP